MAIYSTFFVCNPDELAGGFCGWKPPLVQPVWRDVTNPFTGKTMTIESRYPEWPDADTEDEIARDRVVVGVQGRYEDYLEGRLPAFVRERPHGCLKDLTEIELNALGEATEFEPTVEDALYSPPEVGAVIQRLHPGLLSSLTRLDEGGVTRIAERWAENMSEPEHTHSVAGVKVKEGWATSDASSILQTILRLARQSAGKQAVYVLIEP